MNKTEEWKDLEIYRQDTLVAKIEEYQDGLKYGREKPSNAWALLENLRAIRLEQLRRQPNPEKAASDMYEALRLTHDFLDRQNARYGNETELCLCCHSGELDGLGIKHEDWCPIQKARQALAKAEGK